MVTHGPILSCLDCDEREGVSGGDTICNARAPMTPYVLEADCVTPAWCPLRAATLRELCRGHGVAHPLLSGDYGFTDEEGDPGD
jgi:hypothetical protein